MVKMVRILLFVLAYIFLSFNSLTAQIYDPVSWSFSVKHIKPGEADLIIKAKIEKKWHLYSQFLPSDDGPVATSFNFNESKAYKRVGKVKESKSITEFDKVNQMELTFFEHEAIFTQHIQIIAEKPFKVDGYLEFMVCDDEKCLPPESVDFDFPEITPKQAGTKEEKKGKIIAVVAEGADTSTEIAAEEETVIYDPVKWDFKLSKKQGSEYELLMEATIEEGWHLYSQHLPPGDGPVPTSFRFKEQDGLQLTGDIVSDGELIEEYDSNFMMDLEFFKDKVIFRQKVNVEKSVSVIKGDLEYMVCNDKMCLPPEIVEFSIDVPAAPVATSEDDSNKQEGFSYWGIFFVAFLSGLGALFTPCVFPMIPLTVSYFTKQSKDRAKGRINAIVYGLFILLIYLSLSLPFHLFDSINPAIYNEISTNEYVNLIFFVIFIIFALSFLGAFEITLPNSWINKADKASDLGGMLGTFFMALTLVLVSFTCTGPILGGLLGATLQSAGSNAAELLTVGMLGFGLAFGLPFGLFAFFPGWLNSLPKSGGWLNTVKVVFGFLELAFAFKFLSNADLVLQLGLLQRELFIAIWITIFLLLSLYLLGVFRMAHDSKTEGLSVTRLMFATVSLLFTIYLIPGLWGAPLKIISGFPPPMFYSESPNGVGGTAAVPFTLTSGDGGEIAGDPAHCPHNLSCFHDYEEGMAYARKTGKPVMLDFTGWACVNCRKMEEQVWSDPRVLQRLREDFVLISLYVDEKLKLPEEEQIEVEIGGKKKKLKTVGNKWSYMQASKYKTNSQPYYVLLDHKEEILNGSAAYDPDIEKFINFLDQGKKEFSSRQ